MVLLHGVLDRHRLEWSTELAVVAPILAVNPAAALRINLERIWQCDELSEGADAVRGFTPYFVMIVLAFCLALQSFLAIERNQRIEQQTKEIKDLMNASHDLLLADEELKRSQDELRTLCTKRQAP